MTYDDETLNYVFDKGGGRCWWYGKRLSWKNYGRPGERGGWEVDHSNPAARGGTDYLRNLVPACTSCNRGKQHSRWRR